MAKVTKRKATEKKPIYFTKDTIKPGTWFLFEGDLFLAIKWSDEYLIVADFSKPKTTIKSDSFYDDPINDESTDLVILDDKDVEIKIP